MYIISQNHESIVKFNEAYIEKTSYTLDYNGKKVEEYHIHSNDLSMGCYKTLDRAIGVINSIGDALFHEDKIYYMPDE
jgi:hypothetical protein